MSDLPKHSGDTDAAIEFLKRCAPAGPWTVSADPERRDALTFSDEAALRRWIDRRQGEEIYFLVGGAT